MATKQIKQTDLHQALMNVNDWTLEEADAEIQTMHNRTYSGENPEDILFEYGLEPDYIFDILNR